MQTHDEMLLVSIRWKDGFEEKVFVDSFESLKLLKLSKCFHILKVEPYKIKEA